MPDISSHCNSLGCNQVYVVHYEPSQNVSCRKRGQMKHKYKIEEIPSRNGATVVRNAKPSSLPPCATTASLPLGRSVNVMTHPDRMCYPQQVTLSDRSSTPHEVPTSQIVGLFLLPRRHTYMTSPPDTAVAEMILPQSILSIPCRIELFHSLLCRVTKYSKTYS